MGKWSYFFHHLFGGFLNSFAAAALIYVTGFLELIGSVDQIPFVIGGMTLGILVFTFAGVILSRHSHRPLSFSLAVFIITAVIFYFLNPADRIVTNMLIMTLTFLLFGILSVSTAVYTRLFLYERLGKHAIANCLLISAWAFAFSMIILTVYQYFADSHFPLITLAGETVVLLVALVSLAGSYRKKAVAAEA